MATGTRPVKQAVGLFDGFRSRNLDAPPTPAVSRAKSRSEARAKAVGVGSSAMLGGLAVGYAL